MSSCEQTSLVPSPNMGTANEFVNWGLITMRSSMKDQVEGNIHDLKGNVKQKAGRLTNDPRLEAKGQAEKIAGKVQKKIGQMKRVVGK